MRRLHLKRAKGAERGGGDCIVIKIQLLKQNIFLDCCRFYRLLLLLLVISSFRLIRSVQLIQIYMLHFFIYKKNINKKIRIINKVMLSYLFFCFFLGTLQGKVCQTIERIKQNNLMSGANVSLSPVALLQHLNLDN